MLSFIKEHIVTKITRSSNFPITINKESLISLLTLRKCYNGKVELILSEDSAKKVLGVEIPMPQIRNDSVITGVCETDYLNTGSKALCFQVEKNFFITNLLCNKNGYSIIQTDSKKHTLVEYSSPNIAKPFHVGHLRSTIVGNFVANCLEKKFGQVTRLNYLGDWGTQIGFVQAGLEDLGITEKQLFDDPVRILYKAYVNAYSQPGTLERAKRIFSELECDSSEPVQKEFWEKVRLVTMTNLKKSYNDFGINFDEYCYESDYRITRIKDVLSNLERSGLAKKRNDGLLVLSLTPDMEVPLLREDGTSLYLSRDIAAAVDRINKYPNCDSIFYVVDKSQVEHFENVAKAVFSLTGKDVVKHVDFGRVTGVSSRKGTNLILQDILDKAIDKMAMQQNASENSRSDDPEVTKILAVSALMVYILRQGRRRNFVFNWDLALQGKGDTAIKLQYTHCRLCSLEERCGIALPTECQPELLVEPILLELITEIARSEEVIQSSVEHFESSNLVNYLFRLCNLISRTLSKIAVKGEQVDVAQQRLLVYHTARRTLAKCMCLLGLNPLKSM